MDIHVFYDQLRERCRNAMLAAGGVLEFETADGHYQRWKVPGMRGQWELEFNPAYVRHGKEPKGPYVFVRMTYRRAKKPSGHRGVHTAGYARKTPNGKIFLHDSIQADDPKIMTFLDTNIRALEKNLETRCGDYRGLKRQGKMPGCKHCPVELMCIMGEIKG